MQNDSVIKTILYKIALLLPDKVFLSLKYYKTFRVFPNWKSPKTFNEKLQWLKLYNRKPEYTILVDKYSVKKYVANIIGEEYIIPTIGVWEKPSEIDFNTLPSKFVLKATHDSGRVLICKDKESLDINAARSMMQKSIQRNFYAVTREWPYKNVKRRIIAEQYMEDEDDSELRDYKYMCFNGNVFCCFVCSERQSKDGLKVTFFDKQWNRLPFERHYPTSSVKIPKPSQYEKMIELASILSKNIPFVRCDFYEIKGKVYFGELTFFPGGGVEEFSPEEWDLTLGNLIDLNKLNK